MEFCSADWLDRVSSDMREVWKTSALARSVRRGLAFGALLLIAVAIGYAGLWVYVAGRVKDGFVEWTKTAQAQSFNIAWTKLETAGFPFRFEIRLENARISGKELIQLASASAPQLAISSKGWDFRDWLFAAPNGLSAILETDGGRVTKAEARQGTGAVSLDPAGTATVWLTLWDVEAELPAGATGQLQAGKAAAWLIVPADKPPTAGQQHLGIGAVLQRVRLASPPPPFGAMVSNLAFGFKIIGAVPAAPTAKAIEAWRQAGGGVLLDHFELFWDELGVRAAGNLQLDPDLQPTGSIAATIEGYDQLLTALSVAGRLAPRDISATKFALAILGPSITTSFTMKNGEMFLGPINLGKAPEISWR